jgi:probable DNA metabolism protein
MEPLKMLTYLYDGSVEGLLTALAMTVAVHETIRITPRFDFQPDLFSEVLEIHTDPAIANSFFNQLRMKFSPTIVEQIVNCLFSEAAEIGPLIHEFINLLSVSGEAIAGNFAEPVVAQIHRASQKVSREIERLHGFIRFRKLSDGVYYAAIEPDHNILRLLAPHFTARFGDQPWLIHDLKRQTGIYYDTLRCRFLPEVELNPDAITASRPFSSGQRFECLTTDEEDYQALWDRYFHEIAITERTNRRVQRQRLPKRYWKHLVERVED